MRIEDVRRLLDDPAAAARWLRPLGVDNVERGHGTLVRLAQAGIPLDLLADLVAQLAEHLPAASDADMGLNNLDRFVAAARSPLALASLFQRDREALPILLRIFSTSQHLSDLLVADTESYDLLRMTEGQPVAREVLVDEICAEVAAVADDEAAVVIALRRFKRRETLRICYGDLIRDLPLEAVTRQISHLADAIVEAALRAAWHKLQARRDVPQSAGGGRERFAVLALGKLGGAELNYSSDIDLIFLYDAGRGAPPPLQQAAGEFFDRLGREVVKLLTENTPLGAAYRVDLRLRPDGQAGPIASNLDAALHYYDTAGRTWERQAFVKARAIAGDLELGRQLLRDLEPWIYRRYLMRADITGIKALKRRIEQRTHAAGADLRDVKTGHGGIRDIEFVIQFLQLFNGGDREDLRTGNTLDAIARLEQSGCLTHQERGILEENYRFLRKLEHRLQILFDLQTHLLPAASHELKKLAVRMGYADRPDHPALEAFSADYAQKTELNRKILDHLLHDAFGDETSAAPETDLALDPQPSAQRIAQVLGPYRFGDVAGAYKNLLDLADEKIRFLSTRRCRHFLSAIAPRLLAAIAATPDPDQTLVNLAQVSNSLGGKGVLWELFSFNPPSMQLYVELCSCSQYLSGVLISNPGMIDELLDSLLLDRLSTLAQLDATLAELCHGAENPEPILHSFKSAQQLRVGVRDILGKARIEDTTGALSDIAQSCLTQIARTESVKLAAKFGEPRIGEEEGGPPCELIILALGKFGGRELNYYSDLDIVFLYEADGATVHARRSRRDNVTTNQHYFSDLGQRIIKTATQLGPHGRLYQIDARLRPTGRSGVLAVPLAEFARYYAEGQGQFWERMALCKARIVYGSPRAAAAAEAVVRAAAFGPRWTHADAAAIRHMRARLEETAGPGNLKRGPGGMVDIEFLVQMLQLKFAREYPLLRQPGTLPALDVLSAVDVLSGTDFAFFSDSYRLLRTIEARLRLMSTTARDDLPDDPRELAKLAGLLKYTSADELLHDCQTTTAEIRRRFVKVMERE